jgi:hypothetical protein
MLSIATDAESFAMACCEWPSIAALREAAETAAKTEGCRLDAWGNIVTQLLALDLTAALYDVAIDGLHDAAAMPCTCARCRASAMAADPALKPFLLPLAPRSNGSNPLVRAKYDQTGRYRIRSR